MRRTGRIAACGAVFTLLLAACGAKKQPETGLVSLETAKSYEHVVKIENTEPTPVPEGNDTQEPTGAEDENAGNTTGGGSGQNTDGVTESDDIVYVAVSKLNLRSEPSTESEIIAQAKYGDSFVRLEKGTDGWDKLLYNGQEVYAYAEYLTGEKITGTGSGIAEQYIADAKKK